jgi:hypothetical protein
VSVQAITCALAVRGVSSSEKLLLLALANYADDKMECWPSQKRLAGDTCLSERTVRSLLKALEERRIVSRKEFRRPDGSRSADRITLHFSGMVVTGPDDQPAIISGGAEVASGGAAMVAGGAEAVSGLTTFEPSQEPSVNPQTPLAVLADLIWRLQPKDHKRSTRPDIADALETQVKDGAAKPEIYAALKAYYDRPDSKRDGGQYAKGAHRIVQRGRWRDFLPAVKTARPASPADTARRLRYLRDTGTWKPEWGPKPEPGRDAA